MTDAQWCELIGLAIRELGITAKQPPIMRAGDQYLGFLDDGSCIVIEHEDLQSGSPAVIVDSVWLAAYDCSVNFRRNKNRGLEWGKQAFPLSAPIGAV